CALVGNAAFVSVELIATVSLVFTTFQLTSTALTVTSKAVPAVWASGVPALPLGVPGAAVSPGASSCSFAKAPELTGIAELVLAVLVLSVTLLAVTVALPAVFKVTLKLLVPLTSAALPGNAALVSDEPIATVSV